MKRTSTLVGLLLVLAMLAAACNGAAEAPGEQQTATPDEQPDDDASPETPDGDADAAAGDVSGEITVWIMSSGDPVAQDIIETYGTDFEQEHPGTSVTIEFIPWDGGKDRFINAITSGEVPDLAETGTTWTPEFAEIGGLDPVTEHNPDWLPSLVDAGTVDGALYGLPWYAGNRAFIYRTDVFEDLGLEAPTTWEELEAAAERIKAETDMQYPVVVPGSYLHMLLPMVWQAGGDIAVQENGEWVSAINDEAGVLAFETYARWHTNYAPPETLNQPEAEARITFDNGEAAMMIGGPWDVNGAIAANPDLEGKLATALIPAGPGGSDTFAGGSHLSVFADSDNKATAEAFRAFMLRPEELTKFTDQIGFWGGTVSGINESSLLEDPLLEIFGIQLRDHSRVYPVTPKWAALETDPNPFIVAVQSIIQGSDSQDVMDTLADTINEALNS